MRYFLESDTISINDDAVMKKHCVDLALLISIASYNLTNYKFGSLLKMAFIFLYHSFYHFATN